MRIVTFYHIYRNVDTTEGKGPMVPTDIGFEHMPDALAYVKSEVYADKYGVMGYPGSEHCIRHVTIAICHSMNDFKNNHPECTQDVKRQAALGKLTDEERKLLGLEDN